VFSFAASRESHAKKEKAGSSSELLNSGSPTLLCSVVSFRDTNKLVGPARVTMCGRDSAGSEGETVMPQEDSRTVITPCLQERPYAV
jgi:hypothetical protein